MDDIKSQLVNRLKEANNVLVSVKKNPSVDQFAAAIALTLILNKLGKHATTVFSGAIPSTIEFLEPEKIIETNTDSLRDFIISLDKNKADKLRYKIEDNFVKIFITPYHTSISNQDLVFSQGDFNVDVVVALGVHQKEELDQAITSHGRILHDATVTSINTQLPSNLGSINWSDNKSSSICEMLVDLSELLVQQGTFDTQISNALLTGIVSETQRFSNVKTTSKTMSVSSKLLASGANQQLVAVQLTPKPAPPPPPKPVVMEPASTVATNDKPQVALDQKPKRLLTSASKEESSKSQGGLLEINHSEYGNEESNDEDTGVMQVVIDEQGTLKTIDSDPDVTNLPAEVEITEDESASMPPENQPTQQDIDEPQTLPEPQLPPLSPTIDKMDNTANPFSNGPKMVLQPPSTFNDQNIISGDYQKNIDIYNEAGPGTQSPPQVLATPTMLDHNSASASQTEVKRELSVTPPDHSEDVYTPPSNSVDTMQQVPTQSLDQVRNAVDAALSSVPPNMANQPLESLNAQPVNLNFNDSQQDQVAQQPQPLPPNFEPGSSVDPNIITPTQPPSGAPPVPPPIIPLDDNDLPPAFTAL
jgi:hypothetical protein